MQCPTPATGRTQSIGGKTYGLEGLDTFTKAAPLGSFAAKSPNQVVYRGDHGLAWTEYPDGWPSTYSAGGAEGYQPSTVLSVHNGVLDFYLHSDPHGNPVGADPSPLPAGRRYQTTAHGDSVRNWFPLTPITSTTFIRLRCCGHARATNGRRRNEIIPRRT